VAATGVTLSNTGSNAGTSASYNLTVATGATAGPDNIAFQGAAAPGFTAGVTVAGPSITSQTPAGVAVGAPIGTVITLTGTGFTNTTTGAVTDHGGGALQGVFSYVSATTMNLVLTASPIAADAVVANAPTIVLTQTVAAGVTVTSPSFALTVDVAPTINGAVTYSVGTDVGVGAKAQTVVFHGTGFSAGATVTKFTNGNSVADASVAATVTTVTPTTITATIAIAAPDANFADGYTITNTDGGTVTTGASIFPLLIGAGPTITAVTPTPVVASSTNAVTITGTGFGTGAVVSATSDGTCGAATVVSATSITASCTFGPASSTAVSLVVTNVDGGSATSAIVLPAVTSKPPVAFRVTGAHGYAVPGRTVHMTISGTGFYGQPRITSSAAGTRVRVSGDTGHLLTILVTTKAGTKHRSYTFTIRLANGKTGRANYSVR
jgi:hypothetical protein